MKALKARQWSMSVIHCACDETACKYSRATETHSGHDIGTALEPAGTEETCVGPAAVEASSANEILGPAEPDCGWSAVTLMMSTSGSGVAVDGAGLRDAGRGVSSAEGNEGGGTLAEPSCDWSTVAAVVLTLGTGIAAGGAGLRNAARGVGSAEGNEGGGTLAEPSCDWSTVAAVVLTSGTGAAAGGAGLQDAGRSVGSAEGSEGGGALAEPRGGNAVVQAVG